MGHLGISSFSLVQISEVRIIEHAYEPDSLLCLFYSVTH